MPAAEPTREETPRHGYRGERTAGPSDEIPASLTIALSREAGSRGNTIGIRAGQKLGWPVYNQELLEYVSHEGPFHQNLTEALTPDVARWADERLDFLRRHQSLSDHPSVVNLSRIVLSLGAQGNVLLVGRGAGCILPRATTLHVRIIAPLADRVAYMSQWLRLSAEDAAEQVAVRDRRRTEFLATHFHFQHNDIYQYDLLLNSSHLGEEQCADLIARAARGKLAALGAARGVEG